MNQTKATIYSTMGIINCAIVILILNCFLMVSVVPAQDLPTFLGQISDRIRNDVRETWHRTNDDRGDWAAQMDEFSNAARSTLKSDLDELLNGRNLAPGQRREWIATGVAGFILDYPQWGLPEVDVAAVHYLKTGGSVVFAVDWRFHWVTDSSVVFRITGGWTTWTRNDDVHVTIDQINMTVSGTTWYVVETDGEVENRTFGVKPNSAFTIREEPVAGIDCIIEYENPNRVGSEYRTGERIKREIENNYAHQIRFLVHQRLLKEFVEDRLENEVMAGEAFPAIASDSDGFWSRHAAWVRAEEPLGDTYEFPGE